MDEEIIKILAKWMSFVRAWGDEHEHKLVELDSLKRRVYGEHRRKDFEQAEFLSNCAVIRKVIADSKKCTCNKCRGIEDDHFDELGYTQV